MMKLLMLLFNRVNRGTYWRALGFGHILAQRGYDVTLMAISPHRKRGIVTRSVDGVTLIETPDLMPTSGYDPWDTLNRLRWLRTRSFDLIHAFETRPVVIAPALYLQKRDGTPLIIDWCDWFGKGGSVEQRANPLLKTLLRPVETLFEERFRQYAQGTTVINTILQRKAIDLGIAPSQILLLPNGANVTDIHPQDQVTVRQRLNLPPDALILGYTGAIFPQDAALMAAAFDQICQHRRHVYLLQIGYANINLQDLVQTPTAVLTTGPIAYTQLADYVAACDIGWLPLCNNGANQGRFPMKVHDFMAAGVPLVVTDVGDMGTLVRDEAVGYVTTDEPGPLAQTVLTLGEEAAIRAKMGRRARHAAETKFAWSVVTDTLQQFYEQMVITTP